MPSDRIGSKKRFSAAEINGLKQQLNDSFSALQQGGMAFDGVKLDLRTVVPTAAPQNQGSPNLVAALNAGVWTIYWWNGSSWVDLAASAGGGEANTASNVGTAGTGLFDAKVLVDLQFRKLNAASAKITVTLDAANKKVDLDVATGATATTVCVGNDSRLSDSRTPLAHVLADTTGLGPLHTTSGLTAGQVLRASAAAAAAFAALQAGDLPAHVLATNAALGAQHTISGAAAGQVLRASGAAAANFQALVESDITNLVTDLAAKALATRLINTTAPLTGGGDLSADRTHALSLGAGLANVGGNLASTDILLSKNADQASFVNAQTNISGFTWTPAINEVWDVEIVLQVTMGTAATGVKFYFTGPASFTGELNYEGNIAALNTWQSLPQAVPTVPGTFFVTGIITGNYIIHGTIRTAGTSGAVQLVGITGGATTTCVVKKGSKMICRKSVGV